MRETSQLPWFAPPKTTAQTRTATIVGAGLAGVSIACHLQSLGWQITLLDQHPEFALSTSGNPAGLIKPQLNASSSAVENYYKKSYSYFLSTLDQLLKNDLGIAHSLGDDLANSLSSPAKPCAWLSPRDFCRAQLAQHPDIEIIYNSRITTLKNDSERWQCLDRAGETLSDTPICVLAAGYELNFLLQKQPLSIEPLAGQISHLAPSAINPSVSTACYASHYLIPLKDKTYLCGASHHRTAGLGENQADHDENLLGLTQLLPEHSVDTTQVIGAHVGVRAVSPDHLPIVGGVYDPEFYQTQYDDLHHGRKSEAFPSAKYKNGLFVIGALGSHGISNSPYLGKLLSELIDYPNHILETQTLELLHPARFLIRDLKRKPADRKLAV